MAKKTTSPEEVNPGHYNEFADRAACIKHMVKEMLLNHPVADKLTNFRNTLQTLEGLFDDLASEAASHTTPNPNFAVGDRAYCFFTMVNELLLESKEIAANKKAIRMSRSATNNLWHLYQHLSEVYYQAVEAQEQVDITRQRKKP